MHFNIRRGRRNESFWFSGNKPNIFYLNQKLVFWKYFHKIMEFVAKSKNLNFLSRDVARINSLCTVFSYIKDLFSIKIPKKWNKNGTVPDSTCPTWLCPGTRGCSFKCQKAMLIFMYRRPTLCTLHIAVDFLKSLKIAVVLGGGGCYWDIVHILYPCRWWQGSSTGM